MALDDAIKAQDYNRAWEIASRQNRDTASPALQQRLDTLDQDITRFERTRIAHAQQLANQGRWKDALDSLDEARQRWAHGQAIAHARSELDQRQLRDLLRHRTRLLVSEADWLISERSAIHQLDRFADPSADALRARLDTLARTIATELAILGEWHATHDQLRLAHDALSSAARLQPDQPASPALRALERHLASADREARAQRISTLQDQAHRLMRQYQESNDIEDLLAAREHIQRHRQRGELDREAEQIERLTRQRFEAGLAEGDALYAQAEYQAAYRHWSSIAPLKPGDMELEQRLERTRRVLGSLEQLRRQ